VEASTQQPAGEQETSATAAKATATAMAMATENAVRRYYGTWRRLPWSSRQRLQPHTLRMTLMVATAVSPLSAGHLLRREAGK
jgi:hypothetical protein